MSSSPRQWMANLRNSKTFPWAAGNLYNFLEFFESPLANFITKALFCQRVSIFIRCAEFVLRSVVFLLFLDERRKKVILTSQTGVCR